MIGLKTPGPTKTLHEGQTVGMLGQVQNYFFQKRTFFFNF